MADILRPGVDFQVFLCKEDGNWNLTVYEKEEHAIVWWKRANRPRIWRATIGVGKELSLAMPKPFLERKADAC